MINDDELGATLYSTVRELIHSDEKLSELKINAKKLSKPDAAKVIANNALKYMEAV